MCLKMFIIIVSLFLLANMNEWIYVSDAGMRDVFRGLSFLLLSSRFVCLRKWFWFRKRVSEIRVWSKSNFLPFSLKIRCPITDKQIFIHVQICFPPFLNPPFFIFFFTLFSFITAVADFFFLLSFHHRAYVENHDLLFGCVYYFITSIF